MKIRKISVLTLILVISSCAFLQKKPYSDAAIKSYANDSSVKFDIRKGFNGKMKGFGVLQNKDGIVIKRFTVDLDASWDGDKGEIKHSFVYDDKSKDSRTLLVTVEDDNSYVAIGHDVVGTAVGKQYGGASQMRYVLSIKDGEKKDNYDVDEWTYGVDDKSFIRIMNIDKDGGQKIIMSIAKS